MSERETIVRDKYEAKGYDVIKAGIPDLILLKEGKIEFVEVKSHIDKLSEYQERAFRLLKKHGFIVKLERVDLRPTPEPRRGVKSIPFIDTLTLDEKEMLDKYLSIPYPDRMEYSCFAEYMRREY